MDNYAIVGAQYDENELNIITGGAYIYERDDETGWSDPIPLTLPTLDRDGSDDTGLEEYSRFGGSVAIDEEYAIVGALDDDNELGIRVGSAYIYEIDGLGNWSDPIHLTLPTSPDGDDPTDDTGLESSSQFGHSVAIDGNYAIVGAPGDDNERGTGAGSSYIYERVGTEDWGNSIHLTLPTSPDGDDPTDDTGLESSSQFGSSVAIDGDYAIVGAPDDKNNRGDNAGSAYIYIKSGWRME